jgi:hypothetical protein
MGLTRGLDLSTRIKIRKKCIAKLEWFHNGKDQLNKYKNCYIKKTDESLNESLFVCLTRFSMSLAEATNCSLMGSGTKPSVSEAGEISVKMRSCVRNCLWVKQPSSNCPHLPSKQLHVLKSRPEIKRCANQLKMNQSNFRIGSMGTWPTTWGRNPATLRRTTRSK